MPRSVCRTSGVVVAFNMMRSGEETPKIWLRLVREISQDLPLVVCGITGLDDYYQERDEEGYRAVCAVAGVDYFGVDLRVNDGGLEKMLEALIDKAIARGPVKK